MTDDWQLDPQRPHLFLDAHGMAEVDAITFRARPPRCEGIVLAPEREWEAYRVTPLCVLTHGGVHKMWYAAIATHPGSPHPLTCPRCSRQSPGSKVVCVACGWPLVDIDYLQNEMIGVCYAESSDGIHWTRPDLGLVSHRGSTHNNLILGPCGVPALNPLGPDSERFMGVIEHQRQLYVAVSPDGLRWTRKANPCLPFCADTSNQIIFDPQTSKYVALLRGFPGRRTTVRCEFDDLDQPWPFEDHGHVADHTGVRLVTDEMPTALDIDAHDPALPGLDINHISAHRHGHDAWFGFPALYRQYPPRDFDRAGRENHRFFAQGNDGTWETQLAVSRDGRQWTRPDRTPYLGPGLFGGPDGGINGLCAGMIHRGDEVHQYGFGQRLTHGVFIPGEAERVASIFRFTQKKDRFIAATADARGGRLLTRPFECAGGEICLNIDCGGLGEVSVEVRDASGRLIEGFTHADCDRVDLNHLAHKLHWRGRARLDTLRGKRIRLDFRLLCARLYGVTM